MNKPYLILLADDHVLFRQGIKKFIEETQDLRVVGEVGDGFELIDYLKKHAPLPDMAIVDIYMPNMGGVEATAEIKKHWPEVKVLILTLHNEEEYLNRALDVGADGYMLKDEPGTELLSAIATIRYGGTYVSPIMSESATKDYKSSLGA